MSYCAKHQRRAHRLGYETSQPVAFKRRSEAVALFGAATSGATKRKSLAIQVKLIRVIVEQGRGERQGGLAKLGTMRPPQQSVRSERVKVDPA